MPAVAVAVLLCAPASASAAFGIQTFSVTARDADGTVDQIAASHPDSLDVHLAMNVDQTGNPEGSLRQIQIDLPAGLIGNARNIPRCSVADLEGLQPHCPGSTQIGILRGIAADVGQVVAPVFNVTPAPGSAAAFAVSIEGEPMYQRLRLVGAGGNASVRLSGVLQSKPAIIDVEEEIWGVPASPSHDASRYCQDPNGSLVEGCSSDAEEQPLLTLPASCDSPMRTELLAISTGSDPAMAAAVAPSLDSGGNPRPLIGCEAVPFDPRLAARTESGALAASGLSLGLEVPRYEGVGKAGASVAGLEVKVPSGVALNPSAGSWLSSCSIVMDERPVRCPVGAQIGSVRVRTPLIDHPLDGFVYLDPPDPGIFDSRLGIHLVIDDEASGTRLKIVGRIEADPVDGRLTAIVSDLPRFPFSQMEIEFAGGPRALLTSPPSCGSYASSAIVTPSTTPFSPPRERHASFTLTDGPSHSSCPLPEAERNSVPGFRAGVASSVAGGDSQLIFTLAREDVDQHFGSFDLTLPPGLIANLGSTPLGSAVGSVEVRAGVGPEPLALGGTAYLGGPYRGAPYSLDFVVPAKAGPIDLGTISVRAAVDVDPATARVSVRGDPLPQILGGVPLELRSLRIDLDRPGFIRNPTSCEATAIAGLATTSIGQVAPISDRFQVGDCAALAFRPKLSLRLSGATGRNGHPALRAVLQGGADEAAVAGLGFTLPAGELLDLDHVRALCRPAVPAERCPRGSRLGRLRLRTPFLDEPLSGPIHLRTPSRRLPDFTADLRSARFQVTVHGRATSGHGRLGIRFAGLPDIPISKAVLDLPGGRRGIVVNSRGLCKAGPAVARFDAHSGKQRRQRVRVRLGRRC